jgi:hypothetical protein
MDIDISNYNMISDNYRLFFTFKQGRTVLKKSIFVGKTPNMSIILNDIGCMGILLDMEVMLMNPALKESEEDIEMDITGLNKEVIDEIQKHKWIESEKKHKDIGNNNAALDWIEHHYELWLRSRLSKK